VGSPFSVIAHVSHNGSTQQLVECVPDNYGNFPSVADDEKLARFTQAAKAGYVLGTRGEETKKFLPGNPWLKCGYLLNPGSLIR
jgi:hypothetical protein